MTALGCSHVVVYASGRTPADPPEWSRASCGRCGAYATYHNGNWHVGHPPPRVQELARELAAAELERDRLRAALIRVREALDTIREERP